MKNRYSSLPQIDFVTNAFFQSTQNSEFIEKRRKELENYLTRVLQFPIVRKSYPALRILGINHCIESVPKAHLHKNSFESPINISLEPKAQGPSMNFKGLNLGSK